MYAFFFYLYSIYATFIMVGAPLEINVRTQELVKERIPAIQWAIVTQNQALDILKETEEEVLFMLVCRCIWTLAMLLTGCICLFFCIDSQTKRVSIIATSNRYLKAEQTIR